MHYDVYSDEYKVSMYHWKQLPEFKGLTEDEIWTIMSRIRQEEERQYNAEVEARTKLQRANDAAYLEKNGDKHVLPKESVKLDFGVIIDPSMIDDHGFASKDELLKRKRTIKLSLEDHPKKKVYV